MPTATTATRARVSLTPLPSLEDADLVRRARDGDDDAFEEIVRRYRAPLIRYSARHVGRDHAEDITQHALTSAALHLRADPRPIHLRAWLYRVAHNAAINMRQRKDWGHEQLSPDIDGVPQPPELAAQRSQVREVVSELDRLPARQRTALLLSVFEGLGYDEIAARLDTSPNSVRALLSRARVHLRRAATAIAPLPLLQSLVKKASGILSATGGQGTIAAGGSAIQANIVVVAATTVAAAGAVTAERAISHDPAPAQAPAPALVAAVPAPPSSAIPLNPVQLLPEIAERPAKRDVAPPPPSEPPAPVAPPVEAPPPVEPVPEAPPAEPAVPVAEDPPPAEEAPADEPPPPGDEAGKDEDDPGYQGDPGSDDDPPPDDYTPDPPDPYTPAP